MNKYLTLLVMGFIAPLHASQVLENQIINCQSITSNEQRLACFDRIELVVVKSAAPVATPVATAVAESASSAVATAPVAAAVPVATTATVAEAAPAPSQAIEEFGLEHKRVQQEAPQESLTLTLAKVGKTPYGELIFTFENGQVWRQVIKEAFTASIGESYQLQRGAFNSFFINKEGQFKKTRVRRDK
ncbi:hypothetical protein [Rheinheimera tangshanensis]|jgi:hypothetical protein|uniref:Uncharacterized protein n=1 Tax=Rheinheimera tangshanensis TaxID=400153 RepID=A0A5C8LT75_9GAMM|nr:hypothetical protein [Rheinheimera tangshanensis]TXK79213.1 hypothetical protein FU839_15070 [Rheinheimera tangshanensis]GGM68213.1 hypothetical protein GCM10010920_31480 [Rheinheimera tangshanensis]